MSKSEKDFYQISQKLILKNKSGQILLLKALDHHATYSGFYDFPGGRIHKDEFTVPFDKALNREVREEIGAVKYKLNPRPVAVSRHLISANVSSLKRDVHVLYLLYEADYISGDIIISDEHAGFIWEDPQVIELEKLLKSGNLDGLRMYLK